MFRAKFLDRSAIVQDGRKMSSRRKHQHSCFFFWVYLHSLLNNVMYLGVQIKPFWRAALAGEARWPFDADHTTTSSALTAISTGVSLNEQGKHLDREDFAKLQQTLQKSIRAADQYLTIWYPNWDSKRNKKLSVFFSQDLSCNYHINQMHQKLLMSRYRHSAHPYKKLIYNAFFLPSINNSTLVWGTTTKQST